MTEEVELIESVLRNHLRPDFMPCRCGWDVEGASHIEHVAEMILQSIAFDRVASNLAHRYHQDACAYKQRVEELTGPPWHLDVGGDTGVYTERRAIRD